MEAGKPLGRYLPTDGLTYSVLFQSIMTAMGAIFGSSSCSWTIRHPSPCALSGGDHRNSYSRVFQAPINSQDGGQRSIARGESNSTSTSRSLGSAPGTKANAAQNRTSNSVGMGCATRPRLRSRILKLTSSRLETTRGNPTISLCRDRK